MKNSQKLTDGESIVQKVISEFRDSLAKDVLKPGDKLPSEMELTRTFGVSRNAVREAIKMLVALGAVEIRRGDGTYVAKNVSASVIDPLIFALLLTGGTAGELLELREMLEVGILEIVLRKTTDEDISKMRKAIEVLEEDYKKGVVDKEVLREHDLTFHYAFAGATHNPLITKIAKTIWEMFKLSIGKSVQSNIEDTIEKHRMIFQSVKEKNLDKAKEAISSSLRRWKKFCTS